MISTEAPIIFAKACEMFISELTLHSWNHTEEKKRRTLQKNDIAITIFDINHTISLSIVVTYGIFNL
jgi:histone H3/H4